MHINWNCTCIVMSFLFFLQFLVVSLSLTSCDSYEVVYFMFHIYCISYDICKETDCCVSINWEVSIVSIFALHVLLYLTICVYTLYRQKRTTFLFGWINILYSAIVSEKKIHLHDCYPQTSCLITIYYSYWNQYWMITFTFIYPII